MFLFLVNETLSMLDTTLFEVIVSTNFRILLSGLATTSKMADLIEKSERCIERMISSFHITLIEKK